MINTEIETEEKKEFVSKTLFPGNQVVKINSIKLQKGYSDESDLSLLLYVEGKPMGDDFVGFAIDKEDKSKGFYKGQVGTVKYSRFAFRNKEWNKDTKSWIDKSLGNDGQPLPDDIKYNYRDKKIVYALSNISNTLGITKWLSNNNNKFETIEQLVEQLDKDKPFKDIWIEAAIGAEEYWSKDNHKRQALFLLPAQKPYKNIKLENDALVELVKYDANNPQHLVPAKNIVSSETQSAETTVTPPTTPTVAQAPEDELPF